MALSKYRWIRYRLIHPTGRLNLMALSAGYVLTYPFLNVIPVVIDCVGIRVLLTHNKENLDNKQ